MKQVKYFLGAMFISSLLLTSCNDDDNPLPENRDSILNLSFSGLEDLGDDYVYEGWLIVNGAPVSAGIFSVANGNSDFNTDFRLDIESIDNATAYVLTIEPSPDLDPAPSKVHILAGDIENGTATLTTDHSAAIGTDFVSSEGTYILATPTDGGSDTDENSGVWWVDLTTSSPSASLQLPSIPEGWEYEGWIVVDGTPISTGKFSDPNGRDDSNFYSGTASPGPPFPGEDLLRNAPSGLSFPVDLAGETVVISVEPYPDNSTAPFLLKPLIASVPNENVMDHVNYSMENNAQATNPTGTINIEN